MTRMGFVLVILISGPLSLTACQRAIRNTVYTAYEQVGIDKRDLVRRRVEKAQGEQAEAKEEFQDALSRLQAITNYDGGDLEKEYDRLLSAFEDSKEQAEDVRESIRAVETVTADLFTEWDTEIDRISTPSLRRQSRQMLNQTRSRYRALHASLKRSERRMQPVLVRFEDQVLFLKHNLNAQAVASLRGETENISAEIERLIESMNVSIAQSEKFVQQLL